MGRIGSAQPFGIIFGGQPVRVGQPAPLALLLARDVAALLVAELDASPEARCSIASMKLSPSIFCTNLIASPPSAHRNSRKVLGLA